MGILSVTYTEGPVFVKTFLVDQEAESETLIVTRGEVPTYTYVF